MDRRGLLTLLAVGAGGCVAPGTDGTSTDDGPPTETPPTTPSTPTPVTDAERVEYDSTRWLRPEGVDQERDPFALFVVGEERVRPPSVEPHYVAVQDQSGTARTLRVAVRDRRADEAALDTAVEFPASGILFVELAAVAAYEVSVTVDDEPTTVSIAKSRLDCNRSTTGLLVGADGSVEETTVSTMMGCGT